MNENKEIEEMARDIVRIAGLDVYGKAKYLYNAGYRNVKDKVVLSREEYYELKQAKTLLEFREETIKYLEDANIRYAEELDQVRKEMAREIIKQISNYIPEWLIRRIAKQYGVEVE